MDDRTMTAKLIPLHHWAKLTYGDAAPCSNTLRKWARGDKITPPAEKHGREYFVSPDARSDRVVSKYLIRHSMTRGGRQ